MRTVGMWAGVVLSLAASGCGCGGPGLRARYGELVVVTTEASGRERLLREATVSVPPTPMETVGLSAVRVRNIGEESVTVEAVVRASGDEVLTLSAPEALTVPPGEEAQLAVRFAPPQASDAQAAEVEHRARFTVTSSGVRAGDEALAVEVVGVAVARDCYVPRTLDFGEVVPGQAVTLPLPLSNGSALPATTTLGVLTGASAFTVEGPTSVEVPAGGTASVRFRFGPQAEGRFEAAVPVRRAERCPEATLALLGVGATRALSVSPSRLDFGRLPLEVTAARAVTVHNGSAATLPFLGVRVLGEGFEMGVGSAAAVGPRSSAEVTVTCTPPRLGALVGELAFEVGTTPPTTVRVPLVCTGGGPRIRVDPTPLQFGQVPWSAAATASSPVAVRRRLVVQNVGTPPPAPGDRSHHLVLGRNGQVPWFAVVPRNAHTRPDEFSVVLRGGYDNAVGLPAIAGQNLVEFDVILAARSAMLKEATLLVFSNDAQRPALEVPLLASPRNSESCQLQVAPEGLDFGRTPRGVATERTVTLTNTGAPGSTCLVTGIEMAPGSDAAFAVVDPAVPSLIIDPSRPRTVRVSALVPDDAPEDAYLRGTLRFNVGGAALQELPVDLLVSRCLVVAPPALDFGIVRSGCTSQTRVVNLHNLCGVPVRLDGLATSAGTPFRIVSAPVIPAAGLTIAAAGTVTVGVTMAPSTVGPATGLLTVDYREGARPFTTAVALRGQGDPVGVQTDAFEQGAGQVDLLFVIDDSCSMHDEQAALATNLRNVMTAATQSNSDWHIGVTTTDTFSVNGRLVSTPTNPRVLTPGLPNVEQLFVDKVNVGVSGSGLEQPFEAMMLAVTEPNRSGANLGFLRDDASLAVIIVTDAPEQSTGSVASYLSALRQVKGNRSDLLSISVVGPFHQLAGCLLDGPEDPGRYEEVVRQTSGVQAEICHADWATALQGISQRVFGSRRTFTLASQPQAGVAATVRVNGAVVTGWRYDGALNAVVFTTAPAPHAQIEVTYQTACF